MSDQSVIVFVNLNTWPMGREFNPYTFQEWLTEQLHLGGMPVNADGSVKGGEVRRRADPTNVSVTIYEWFPEKILAT